MIIKGAKVFDIDRFTERELYIENGIISDSSHDDIVIDATGYMAIPGLVDIHLHGAKGSDFCDGTVEGIKKLATYEASRGVLAICPATMTYPEDKLIRIMESARAYNEEHSLGKNYADLVGINMEGPFINKDRAGAQNPEYIIPADSELYRRLQKSSGNLIKLIDIAPECYDNLTFIEENAQAVNISLAHTDCDYDTALEAFSKGANHLTHLFNAMPGLNHRNPGPIAAGVKHGAYAEIIADGIHVHPAMVRLAFEMFGSDKMVLISDSMRACGLEDGEYELGGQSVIVNGRKAVLKESDDTIAGSVTDLLDCMRIAINEMGISPEDAVRAATYNPAKSIGVDDRYGSFLPGRVGIVLLMDSEMNLVEIVS